MAHHIDEQFLYLDDFRSDAVARQPPRVRIKLRIRRVPDEDPCLMADHFSIHYSSDSARVIGRAYEDNRSKFILVAPAGQCLGFVVLPRDRSRNLFNEHNAQRF